MKNILSSFFQGLLYLVPIAVTLYVLVFVVRFADSLFAGIPLVNKIPGMGLIITLVAITLAGYLGSRFLTTPVVSLFNRTLDRVPFIKLIYTSVRDLMKAFVGEKRKFDKPAIVCMDAQGINHRLGFVTKESMNDLGLDGMVAVYCPYPYSVMGDLIVVPAKQVRLLHGVNAVELMKMVVSGGVTETQSAADNKSQNKNESDSAQQ